MGPPKLLQQLVHIKALLNPNNHGKRKSRRRSRIPSTIHIELEDGMREPCVVTPPRPSREILSTTNTIVAKPVTFRDRSETTLQTSCSSLASSSGFFFAGGSSSHHSVQELERHRQHPTTVVATVKPSSNPLAWHDAPKMPIIPPQPLPSSVHKRPELTRASTESRLHVRPTMHDKSLSFRIRKRNKALSNKDFGRLLDISRGWTFDPNNTSTSYYEDQVGGGHASHHNERTKNHAYAQGDFERFIFEPPEDGGGSLLRGPRRLRKSISHALPTRTLPKDASSCTSSSSSSSLVIHRSDSDLEREEAIHPLFRLDLHSKYGETIDDDKKESENETGEFPLSSVHATSVATMASF